MLFFGNWIFVIKKIKLTVEINPSNFWKKGRCWIKPIWSLHRKIVKSRNYQSTGHQRSLNATNIVHLTNIGDIYIPNRTVIAFKEEIIKIKKWMYSVFYFQISCKFPIYTTKIKKKNKSVSNSLNKKSNELQNSLFEITATSSSPLSQSDFFLKGFYLINCRTSFPEIWLSLGRKKTKKETNEKKEKLEFRVKNFKLQQNCY